MGQYPVINISLKGMKQPDFETAYEWFKYIISEEYQRHTEVLMSDKFDDAEKKYFNDICGHTASYSDYTRALKSLSEFLFQLYSKNVIILIDEYDVPLENAYFDGFYDKMINLICSAFESALKTNNFLGFAVLTGCLRISKESIFTGLNNLKVYSVMNNDFSEYFGFTDSEVYKLTKEFGLEDKVPDMRLWYDGYLFGNTGIYNPWSVLQYISSARAGEEISCQPYWINTSSNSIIYKLIRESGEETREMVEKLMNGGSITVPIYEDTVYADIDVNSEHIWSFLLFTGYLKHIKTELRDNLIYLTMVIPNTEVKSIYQRTIMQWFKEKTVADSRSELFNALISGDIEAIEDTIPSLPHCRWLIALK